MRKPNTKRRRPNGKDTTKDDLEDFSDSRETKFKKTKGSNDPAWYANNPQLLKDAASYPFSQPVGRRWETNSITATKFAVVPGVISLRCRPTFGFGGRINIANGAITADVNNPLNVAANEIYSWVRHKNSGAKNYEATDLMMYLFAMSQVYSFITWAMRIYGLARMYEQRNRYMPVALCEANGVNYDSIKNNLANYRYGLNVLINKAASLKVPAGIPLFQREAFLYMNIYTEGSTVKDQLYMYTPDTFLKFSLDASGAGQLTNSVQVPLPTGTLWTFQDILDTGNQLFQAVWDEEDFGTMSGDIEKAFEGNVLNLFSLNEDYGLVPIYDELVLTQMKNVRVLSPDVNTALHQVPSAQYTSLLVPLQYFTYLSDYSTDAARSNCALADFATIEKAMTIDSIEPDPKMVIEATRGMSCVDENIVMPDANNVNHNVVFIAACSEICTNAIVTVVDASTNLIAHFPIQGRDWINEARISSNLAYFINYMHTASFFKSFKYAPEHAVYVASTAGLTDPTTWTYDTWFEVDNYSTVGSPELKKLHESALLSLLHVNSISSNART